MWLTENILVTKPDALVADAYRTVAKRCGGKVVGEANGKATRIMWVTPTDRRILLFDDGKVISLESTDSRLTEQLLNDLAFKAQRQATKLT